VLLVGRHLEVVGADGRLNLIRVVEPLDVVEIADVERGNVVGSGQGQVKEPAVLGEVGAGEEGGLAKGASLGKVTRKISH